MFSRRSFLGKVVGLVGAGFSIEFLARLPQEPTQRIILPYRMVFRDSISGYTIQAPGVKEIIKIDNGFSFVSEELLVTHPIKVSHVALFTNDGKLIRHTACDTPITGNSKDKICGIQRLTIDREVDAVEELVDIYIRETMGESNARRY